MHSDCSLRDEIQAFVGNTDIFLLSCYTAVAGFSFMTVLPTSDTITIKTAIPKTATPIMDPTPNSRSSTMKNVVVEKFITPDTLSQCLWI